MLSETQLLHMERAAQDDYFAHMAYWKSNADSLPIGLQCFMITWNYFVSKDKAFQEDLQHNGPQGHAALY